MNSIDTPTIASFAMYVELCDESQACLPLSVARELRIEIDFVIFNLIMEIWATQLSNPMAPNMHDEN